MDKARLAYIHRNVGQLFLFLKNVFRFLYFALFGYDKSANEGTVKFLLKFGEFSPFPQKLGDEATNPVTEY